jgi:hypothetical protein
MSADSLDLAALIDPVPLEQFFAMYWEANPLHIQGRNARYYDQILTVGDLENLIAAPDARYPRDPAQQERCVFSTGGVLTRLQIGRSLL